MNIDFARHFSDHEKKNRKSSSAPFVFWIHGKFRDIGQGPKKYAKATPRLKTWIDQVGYNL